MNESPLHAISNMYHEDAGFRAAVEEDAKAALASKGLEINGPAEVSVAANTEDTVHVVFPPDPNMSLPDGALDAVSGGWGGYPNGITYNGVHYTPAQLSAGGRYDRTG